MNNNNYTVEVRNFAENTDADGQIITKPEDQDDHFQWIIIATNPDGRLAYLGFTGVWSGHSSDTEYNQTKVYAITDRPVYRPGQKVHFKLWVNHAQYDQDDKSDFANQTFNVDIQNPKGEKILSKAFTADNYGGMEGELELPSDAALGIYQVLAVNYGSGSFRVEEYKKPEFEVTIEAPTEPVGARRQSQSHHSSQILFWFAGHRRQSKLQSGPHQLLQAVVSACTLGLVVRPRLLVVCRRLLMVPGLEQMGLHAANSNLVGL